MKSYCDGVTRRQVIQAGLAGLAGLSLPELFRLRARSADSGLARKDTAVIYVTLDGGPSQFETYDPKPEAGTDIRGDFGAIRTSVPGVVFSDVMPKQAALMHRLTLLRSIHHPSTQHSSSVHLMKTGYYCRADSDFNEMPSLGSCVSRLRGPVKPQVPPYVLIHHGESYDRGHYLGSATNPFFVKAHYEQPLFQVPNLALLEGISSEQLNDRKTLLARFDEARRVGDLKGHADALDDYQRQAFELVTGSAARRAFQIDLEPPAVRDRYGRNLVGQRLLMARRLVEHGVTFVTAGTFSWDHHGNLWKDLAKRGPEFDQALSALVDDLHDRGLSQRVLVVAMGEFGREPRISTINAAPPGRDHWGDAMSVLLAGGGLPGGAVVGATDAKGSRPVKSPYRLECVLALMYRHLGIDPALTFNDPTGRPRNLLEIRDKIRELEG